MKRSDIACIFLAALLVVMVLFYGWLAGWWFQGIFDTPVNPTMY